MYRKLIAFLLLVQLAAAADIYSSSPISLLGNWVPAAALALTLAFFISGLAFMIGVGFRFADVEQWAKTEFWEASLSAILVGIIGVLILMLSNVSLVLTGNANHFDAALIYAQGAYNDIVGAWFGALGANLVYASFSTFSFATFFPVPILPFAGLTPIYLRFGANFSLWSGYGAVMSAIYTLFTFMNYMLFGLVAQKMLIIFAASNMLTVFLPLGLLCRAFPLTRKIGGTILALALALYFVFPITVAMNKPIFDLFHEPLPQAPPPDAWQSLLNFGAAAGQHASGQTMVAVANAFRPLVKQILLVSILFILDLIITITAFRDLSLYLGGDPQIFGLGKLGV